MIIFVSDLHLTDGTSGTTIKPGAFEKFVKQVDDMVYPETVQDVKVVFLGDILDVIRSTKWLDSGARPWDANSQELKDKTTKIVEAIVSSPNNKACGKYLSDLKDKLKKKKVQNITFEYVIGNHDWLINRYPETRRLAADFLCMDYPADREVPKFEGDFYNSPHKVFARHGDIHDPFNFEGNRDASSLGDAIVIDLLNKFPDAVGKKAKNPDEKALVGQLKEIDNVRPLIDAPKWIQGFCAGKKKEEERLVKETWDEIVDQFFRIKFIKDHDSWWPLDKVDGLQALLTISKGLPMRALSSLPLKRFNLERGDYQKKASEEHSALANEAEFIIYGHTHEHMMVPLDVVQTRAGVLNKLYINTGTWRRTHQQTEIEDPQQNIEFMSWDVMTFVAIYQGKERQGRRFEVWNGSLG